ncbi:MAG TPA: Rieske 2Fe-2S domain-containing protein [Nitrososphaeraceae archaeon]|nr:Rieske 2Fe-2S domain-containing protein [Nitrososphaeraceae archaeon]
MSEDFVKVADIKDIRPSQMKEIQVKEEHICLVNLDGKYYAIGNVCTHEGGPLVDGTLEGFEVECPWHGSKFDVRTGEVINPPASEPEPIFEVKVDGNNILIRKKNLQSAGTELSQQTPTTPATNYELTLIQRQSVEGTDVMSFRFSKKLDYTAGQYAFFDLGGVNNDPKGPVRHFTISSSPTEDSIMITTRIRDTPYKARLSSLQEGARVKVRGPEGKFVLHEDYTKPAIFLSGGIGVTPFRSMIKYATDNELPIRIVMFNSNRNIENILFKKEFDEWKDLNKNLKIIYTITEEEREGSASGTAGEWNGERGRINKAMLTRYLSNEDLANSIYYTCGPPGMIEAMQSLLVDDLQISKERIRTEEFTGY